MAVAQLLLRPYLFLYIFLVLSPTTHSIIESKALLKLKKSFTKADALSSWVPGSSPCKEGAYWIGLICYKGIVAGLRLEGMNLSGNIDVEALLEMPALRSVSITNNAFSGPIPEFNRLGALKALYLSGNQFSGEIPSDYFAKMDSLKKIYLSDNKLTGKIPSSLAQLPNLMELHLENNQFIGEIPSLDQPTLTSINVSNNRLEGEIPVSSFSRFNASSFAGNAGLCGEKLGRECQKALDQPTTGNGDGSKKMIAAIMTSVVAFISIAAVIIVRFRRNREDLDAPEDVEEEAVEVHVSQSVPNGKEADSMREEGNNSSCKGSINGKGVGMGELVVVNDEKGVFGLSDLMKASAEVLENGALVSSYKAVMANGVAVVVKRMKEMNTLGRDVFDAEMRRLANQRHQNILTPLAYHYRKDEKLLVYEYIPGRSLLHLLHGERGPSPPELDWPSRLKIVKGIAKGMGYLHTELASSDIPHGNLKSSNVLLSPDYDPLISEYGFSPLINPANAAQELFAYKAPEAAHSGQLSPACDVYCLGIVILEILTGKYPSQYLSNTKGGIDVVQWVASAIADGRESEVFDPEIASSVNSIVEMKKLLYIGAACTETNPEQRLDMMEAVRRIEEIQVEGGQGEARAMHVLPSLRDGYADSVPQPHVSRSSQESLPGCSGRMISSDSIGSRSGHHNDNNFSFDFSSSV
ncbi:hypothetical protein I3842_02G131300 [Carya illinoinensis]|uniref:Protein kinase domain-containing protein n=1 Tax=Carya illinoinensis TaxID=32201 RepID=A0A922FVB1_CARIL|nr:hypothetical protein I3842_02G131300 [Carya illinoinensis]